MTDRDRLIELLEQAKEKAKGTLGSMNNGFGAWYADYILADGWIRPPCKVGDMVYIIRRNKVKKCEVVFVGISADERCSHFNFVENYADGTFKQSYSMVFEVIGKTLFLTKEEAEQVLAERRCNNA